MISQIFQRPSQCAPIGSLSLVAPTTILKKPLPTVPFRLLDACAGLWVAVCSLFVLFSLALPAEPAGHAWFIFYTSAQRGARTHDPEIKEVRCSFYEFSKPIRFSSNLVETYFNPFPIRKCKKNWGSPCWFSRWR